MSNEERFHHNCELWSRVAPKKALFLSSCDTSAFSFITTAAGEQNLAHAGHSYHDNVDANAEACNWFNRLDLSGSTVLYVYGVGLGYGYLAARQWLSADPRHTLIFLEDELALISHLFQTEIGTQILEDQQVQLHHFSDMKEFETLFDEIYWDVVLSPMVIAALPFYAATHGDTFEALNHMIVYESAIKDGLIEEYMRYGASFHRNFFSNILSLAESWRGSGLFGQFEGVPAIICGAGPSLERNGAQLPDLLDRAIIFGGGSALNALMVRDTLPHFGVGIDPNSTQQCRLSSSAAYELPFFYRNRIRCEAFKLIHGPRLYIPGAGGYEVADWFDQLFDLEEEWIDEGHNVVNFGIELANKLGCNPIILVGVDLAYTGDQAYATGIDDEATLDLNASDDPEATLLLKEDIYGAPVYTLWKWMAEAEWISDYAQEHPSLTIINSTEGGLGIAGIPNIPLKEAVTAHCSHSYDLTGRILGEILTSAMPAVTEERVVAAVDAFGESLSACIDHITLLISENEQLQQRLDATKEPQLITQSGLAALAETELAEEPAYTHLLGLFNLVYSRVHNKEVRLLQSEERHLPEWQKQQRKATTNHKRLVFLRDVARINLLSINDAIATRRAEHNR